MRPQDDQYCYNCRFWEGHGGTCMRYPPPNDLTLKAFPPVDNEDWCGEWQEGAEPELEMLEASRSENRTENASTKTATASDVVLFGFIMAFLSWYFTWVFYGGLGR